MTELCSGVSGLLVALPIESGIDHDRLRHPHASSRKSCVRSSFWLADDVTEHFVRPVHVSGDRFRVGIEQQFRTVEAQTVFRIVRTGDAKTVQLSRTHIGQKHVPDLIGLFANWNADVFLGGIDAVEQAKINRGRVLGKDGEVDAVPHPGRAERIGIAKESPYRSHKRAAHLSGIESRVGNLNGEINEDSAGHGQEIDPLLKATRGRVELQKLAQKLEVSALIFARSALGVRGVFASL